MQKFEKIWDSDLGKPCGEQLKRFENFIATKCNHLLISVETASAMISGLTSNL